MAEQQQQEANKTVESSSTKVKAVTTTGEPIELDTSEKATKETFGFCSGDLVRFMKSRYNGKLATIVGTCENGMLWFRLEGSEQVQTTSCRCREEYLRQYGWLLDTGSPMATA